LTKGIPASTPFALQKRLAVSILSPKMQNNSKIRSLKENKYHKELEKIKLSPTTNPA
jgi:hypothetical protein